MSAGAGTGPRAFTVPERLHRGYKREVLVVQCVLEEDPPRMLSFGLHDRIIGHPGRALGLARLLDWLAGQPRVWITRRADIARHWRKEHPAP